MTQGLFLLSDMLAACIRAAVYLLLVSRLLSAGAKRAGGRFFALLFSGVMLLSACFLPTDAPDFYRRLPEALFLAVCAARRLQIPTRMCLFVGIYFEIAVAFWQFLLAAGFGVLFRSQAFFDRRAAGGQLALWLLHLMLAAAALLFSRRDGLTDKDMFRAASLLSAAGFLAVVTLSEQTRLALAHDTLDMWTILSVVLMMALLVFNLNRQYETQRELSELKAGQAELLERDYTALNRAYALNAKLFHDLHNHIGALRQLLSHERYAQALQYLDELQAPVREMTDTVWTGDLTVDYLINQKSAEAKAADVAFEAQVEFPRAAGLKSADLCAILGNLLDNALEAAQTTAAPQPRFVRLMIRRANHLLVIRVENSTGTAPVQENGALKTTKTESGLHGWGLKSARAAAEKYDGVLQTAYEDGVFRAVATLSFHAAFDGSPQPSAYTTDRQNLQ